MGNVSFDTVPLEVAIKACACECRVFIRGDKMATGSRDYYLIKGCGSGQLVGLDNKPYCFHGDDFNYGWVEITE